MYGFTHTKQLLNLLCIVYLRQVALLCVHYSFAMFLKRKRKLVALLLLSYRCIVTINVLWLFLTVPWVGLQCVIVAFPYHTNFLPFYLYLGVILRSKRCYMEHFSC